MQAVELSASDVQARLDLAAAADYMEKHGKCDMMFETVSGMVCAHGAIGRAVGHCTLDRLGVVRMYEDKRWNEAADRLDLWLQETGAGVGVHAWNARNSVEVVVAGLRAAARERSTWRSTWTSSGR